MCLRARALLRAYACISLAPGAWRSNRQVRQFHLLRFLSTEPCKRSSFRYARNVRFFGSNQGRFVRRSLPVESLLQRCLLLTFPRSLAPGSPVPPTLAPRSLVLSSPVLWSLALRIHTGKSNWNSLFLHLFMVRVTAEDFCPPQIAVRDGRKRQKQENVLRMVWMAHWSCSEHSQEKRARGWASSTKKD